MAEWLTDIERNFMSSQLKISREQKAILEKQQKFNKVTALATTILAIGIFLEIILTFLISDLNWDILTEIHWIIPVILICSLGFFLVVMGILIIVTFKTFLSEK